MTTAPGFGQYLKAGSQKQVGGPGRENQIATGATLSTGTIKFTVTVRNNTGASGQQFVGLSPGTSCSNFTVTVKQGTKNVTSEVLAGTYQTPPSIRAAHATSRSRSRPWASVAAGRTGSPT